MVLLPLYKTVHFCVKLLCFGINKKKYAQIDYLTMQIHLTCVENLLNLPQL